MTILDTIVENKKVELDFLKHIFSENSWTEQPFFSRGCYSLKESLSKSDTGIIAEFKRKSPSKGFIKEQANPEEIVVGYENNGASGVSILQDMKFFGGGAKDMNSVRTTVHIPLLYKEFVIDEYQLLMAKATGADVVLLIASILSEQRCMELAKRIHELGMESLLELHTEEEIGHINDYIDIIGINNRNLKNFEVNLDASILLAHKLPNDFVKISESGISEPETVVRLRNEGFRGFLMGENFMKPPNPAISLGDFIQNVRSL